MTYLILDMVKRIGVPLDLFLHLDHTPVKGRDFQPTNQQMTMYEKGTAMNNNNNYARRRWLKATQAVSQ